MLRLPDRRTWLIPVIGFLYLFPFPYFPALRSPNEGSRLYQVRAIVDDGTFAVNGPLERYGPMGDLSVYEGKYYPNKAPGISMLGAVVYWLAEACTGFRPEAVSNEVLTYLLRIGCCALPTVVFLVPLRRRLWLWAESGLAADLVLLTYALGSLAYTYGLLFFSHQLAAVLLCGSWLAVESARERESLRFMALAGLLAGAAVLTEYTAALGAAPLFVYATWIARRRLAMGLCFALASLPPQLGLLAYHDVAFGSPFRVGYQNNVSQTFQGWHHEGFMGVSTPTLRGLLGSYFDPARGLFVYCPMLLLAPLGIWWLYRRSDRRDASVFLAVLFVLYSYFTSAFVFDKWGWTVGPRHLAPLAAFLTVPCAIAVAEARLRGAIWEGVSVALCLVSVVVTSLATVVYPHYPEDFGNGFFEVTVPLLRAGYLPSNILTLLFGWGGWTWAVYFAPWVGLLIWMLFFAVNRPPARLVAFGVAAVLLAAFGLTAQETPQRARMLQFIEQSYRARV
jgi:hypothetical protein